MMNLLRRPRVWVIAAAILLGALAVPTWNATQTWLGERALAATHVDFRSLPQALAESRRSGRPVFVDFSAIWCPTCRALHNRVFTDPAVQRALAQDYVPARVDYDSAEARTFERDYQVRGFPSLLVLDGDGHLLRRLPVEFDPAKFAQLLAAAGAVAG